MTPSREPGVENSCAALLVVAITLLGFVAGWIGTFGHGRLSRSIYSGKGTVKANKYRRFSASNPAERVGYS